MNTLFDKIWDAHVVQKVEDGPTQLYIDRLYCHEVTSPQAFAGLRARGIKCFRPEKIFCMPDHNTPTHDQDKPIEDAVSKMQVDTLAKNAKDFGLEHFGMMVISILLLMAPWGRWLSASAQARWRWCWLRSVSFRRVPKRCALRWTAGWARASLPRIWRSI